MIPGVLQRSVFLAKSIAAIGGVRERELLTQDHMNALVLGFGTRM